MATFHFRRLLFIVLSGCLVTTLADELEFEGVKIGGALRTSYIRGDYAKDSGGAPQRGGNGGNFELDTFRLNIELDHESLIGAGEYRFYDGYHFLHTGWLGHKWENDSRIELGLVRTPFGVGPYGPANSWFFDQHYYVGLADKMRLGANYSRKAGRWELAGGYYFRDMWDGKGSSEDSARYSFAVVREDVGGIPGSYRQTHQLNLRANYKAEELLTTFGASAQWAMLDARDERARNAASYALSIHSHTQWGPLGVKLQLSGYEYNVRYRTDSSGVQPSRDLIVLGAYDFAWPTAKRGLIPSAAVSYTIKQPLSWIDSATFYNDFSIILKDGKLDDESFHNSALNITGVSLEIGGWFIYIDHAISNGNLFVGDRYDVYGDSYSESRVSDAGANRNNRWNSRFNVNLGYYF